MRKGTGDLARLGSAQISSGVKETFVPGQVCKVFPAQHRVGAGLGPSTDAVRKLPRNNKEAPSPTGTGVSVFLLSVWRRALSPDSAVMRPQMPGRV